MKQRHFKVEILKNCKVCGQPIVGKRRRSYCSHTCRNKFYNKKYQPIRTIKQLEKYDREASEPNPYKCQCLVCGRWYIQVGSHVVIRHGFKSCREYREYFDLEVKRGIVPEWYRKEKGDKVFENGTVNNLKVGKKFWFKPGDPRAGKYQRSPITMERLSQLGKSRTGNNRPRV